MQHAHRRGDVGDADACAAPLNDRCIRAACDIVLDLPGNAGFIRHVPQRFEQLAVVDRAGIDAADDAAAAYQGHLFGIVHAGHVRRGRSLQDEGDVRGQVEGCRLRAAQTHFLLDGEHERHVHGQVFFHEFDHLRAADAVVDGLGLDAPFAFAEAYEVGVEDHGIAQLDELRRLFLALRADVDVHIVYLRSLFALLL